MTDDTLVLIVDDDPFMQEIFKEALLGASCRVATADSGADALMIARSDPPGLIVLDVDMPGMDGYETCRHLRASPATCDAAVLFVSAKDGLDDRLQGYEAGGDDYVTKPFAPAEFAAKVQNLLKFASSRTSLKRTADYATRTAMTAMTSLGEMGSLIASLKAFNASGDHRSLGEAVLAGLGTYGLLGAVQIRTPDGPVTLSHQGQATPLEVSVIAVMAGMDRIHQFRSRISITFPTVSVLVSNMPIDDPDLSGRLRDHLAILAEGADVRAVSITDALFSHRRGTGIEAAVQHAAAVMAEIDADQRWSRQQTDRAVHEMIDKMELAVHGAALTELQDREIADTFREGIDRVIMAQADAAGIQAKMAAIIEELRRVSAIGPAPASAVPC